MLHHLLTSEKTFQKKCRKLYFDARYIYNAIEDRINIFLDPNVKYRSRSNFEDHFSCLLLMYENYQKKLHNDGAYRDDDNEDSDDIEDDINNDGYQGVNDDDCYNSIKIPEDFSDTNYDSYNIKYRARYKSFTADNNYHGESYHGVKDNHYRTKDDYSDITDADGYYGIKGDKNIRNGDDYDSVKCSNGYFDIKDHHEYNAMKDTDQYHSNKDANDYFIMKTDDHDKVNDCFTIKADNDYNNIQNDDVICNNNKSDEASFRNNDCNSIGCDGDYDSFSNDDVYDDDHDCFGNDDYDDDSGHGNIRIDVDGTGGNDHSKSQDDNGDCHSQLFDYKDLVYDDDSDKDDDSSMPPLSCEIIYLCFQRQIQNSELVSRSLLCMYHDFAHFNFIYGQNLVNSIFLRREIRLWPEKLAKTIHPLHYFAHHASKTKVLFDGVPFVDVKIRLSDVKMIRPLLYAFNTLKPSVLKCLVQYGACQNVNEHRVLFDIVVQSTLREESHEIHKEEDISNYRVSLTKEEEILNEECVDLLVNALRPLQLSQFCIRMCSSNDKLQCMKNLCNEGIYSTLIRGIK